MVGVFLQAAADLDLASISASEGILGAFIGFIVAFLIIMVLLAVVVWVYSSLAFMAISRKTGVGPGGIAWIPIIGKPILSAKIVRMHWWPILLLAAYLFPGFDLFFVDVIIGLAALVFAVYWFIWGWKVFEAVGRPGWWILFNIIPLVGTVVYLILLGVAAWGEVETSVQNNVGMSVKK